MHLLYRHIYLCQTPPVDFEGYARPFVVSTYGYMSRYSLGG